MKNNNKTKAMNYNAIHNYKKNKQIEFKKKAKKIIIPLSIVLIILSTIYVLYNEYTVKPSQFNSKLKECYDEEILEKLKEINLYDYIDTNIDENTSCSSLELQDIKSRKIQIEIKNNKLEKIKIQKELFSKKYYIIYSTNKNDELYSYPYLEKITDGSNNKVTKNDKKKDKEKEAEEKLYNFDIEDSITNMANEYYQNESRADKTYKGKRIKTTGTIRQIDTQEHLFGGYETTITIDENGAKYGIYCIFDKKHTNDLNKYNKNDTITLIGTMRQKAGDMYMDTCVIAK